MHSVSSQLAERLNALRNKGVIAGWQNAGGPNYGLSKDKSPLPALIFPLTEGPASTYYDEPSMANAVTALERFGALQLSGRR